MGNVKAIETNYNGYRFRSRLEARWAVFFEAAFIDYEYEPEGFVLDDGTCYLPDFYLPQFHMYVEIKPKDIDYDEFCKARKKLESLYNADMFYKEGKGITVALFEGEPLENLQWIYCNSEEGDLVTKAWFPMKIVRGAYSKTGKGRYGKNQSSYGIIIYANNENAQFKNSSMDITSRLINRKQIDDFISSFKSAKLMARRARFEFTGE